jgi:Fe-Mn family superoxide dismutase
MAAPLRSDVLAQPAPSAGLFTVPPLGYPFDALEPYIDALTMQIHHDKRNTQYPRD